MLLIRYIESAKMRSHITFVYSAQILPPSLEEFEQLSFDLLKITYRKPKHDSHANGN